jgi:hypothetical protein
VGNAYRNRDIGCNPCSFPGRISRALPPCSGMTDLFQQSIDTAQNVVNQAFSNQGDIGRMNFLRGHISRQWYNAYCELHTRGNRTADGSLWASKVVAVVLNYSLSIWKFCCDLLHGTTVEDAQNIWLDKLRREATKAYKEFASNAFILSYTRRSTNMH